MTDLYGPIPVFPTLPVGFPMKISPTFKTIVGETKTGWENRFPCQPYALWQMELKFELLRDQTQNITPYAQWRGFQEYESLVQNFLMLYGQFGLFYFSAFWDNSRLNQTIGVGDGGTTRFVIVRTWGNGTVALNEPIGGLNSITAVYLNGVPTSAYIAGGNVITFNSPPGGGVIISMTFSFFYLCRFVVDDVDFEEFMANLWAVGSLKFRSTLWISDLGLTGGAQLTISVTLLMPSVPDTTPLGTAVATFTVARADRVPFTGTVGFGAPNFDDGGRFIITGSAPGPYTILINPAGPGLPAANSLENITVTATN